MEASEIHEALGGDDDAQHGLTSWNIRKFETERRQALACATCEAQVRVAWKSLDSGTKALQGWTPLGIPGSVRQREQLLIEFIQRRTRSCRVM